MPWHFLYFLPEPHGHGSLRPTFGLSRYSAQRAVVTSVGIKNLADKAKRLGIPLLDHRR